MAVGVSPVCGGGVERGLGNVLLWTGSKCTLYLEYFQRFLAVALMRRNTEVPKEIAV